MSEGRAAMRMTDDEVAAFLEEGRRVQVATHGPGEAVHLVPLSYVMIDGRLTLWTDGDSQKVANLRRDSRITCLIEVGQGFEEFRAVQIRGRADVVDDLETSVQTGLALFARGGPEGQSEQAQAYARSLAPIRVTVTVHPERVVSWDHRKLMGVRPDEIGT
jgi:nitroimidazol reductase NimA-like FMN-containing flavoprotein (pyridoxamine 5'-phosphate oxidase superfamily)